MNSAILQTLCKAVIPLLLMTAIWFFLRGHNEPGGGFIAGLVFASAYVLYGLAFGPQAVRESMRLSPRTLMAFGLLLSVAAGLIGVFDHQAFLTGLWTEFETGFGKLKLGTPLLFDLGVMLVVIGAVNSILLELTEAGESNPQSQGEEAA
ncbi:MAG TPA: Na+/H+ antiporter subunit B [Fimbriimonadaceae bacterium]|nr:Na+/H+ antiporter subunit B [Fimbriimonadaceae bacterium]HRJ32761.1 Na+/H+ antiporter subunit B [Fimbriimonadaceae bacterium]